MDGRISALIELGAGFHPEISGRENIFINGIMLGLTKKEVERRFDEIVEFAEMQDFIDAPVKTYSSGMYMRLGFAVAIHVDPEVLLIDEVLAVGDEGFTHKCLDKFAEFRRRNKTILLVTHSLDLVEKFCDEALWLDKGQTKAEGEPKRVVASYLIDVEKTEEVRAVEGRIGAPARRPRPARHGGDRRPAGRPGRDRRGADRHVQGHRGPLGLARGRDHRRHAARRATVSRGTSSSPARPVRVQMAVRAHHAAEGLRLRRRHLQRRRRVLLRHQHQPRGAAARRDLAATAMVTFEIDSLELVEGTYRWTSPCTSSTAIPTTTTGCSTPSA